MFFYAMPERRDCKRFRRRLLDRKRMLFRIILYKIKMYLLRMRQKAKDERLKKRTRDKRLKAKDERLRVKGKSGVLS